MKDVRGGSVLWMDKEVGDSVVNLVQSHPNPFFSSSKTVTFESSTGSIMSYRNFGWFLILTSTGINNSGG
jgi:hypothetical protein